MDDVTVVCTPGGASDNSYISLAGAATYFSATRPLLGSEWMGYAEGQRSAALVQATTEIEALGGTKSPLTARRALFEGMPYDDAQALHFPRWRDQDLDGVLVVPVDLEVAVCEQALFLLRRQGNPRLIDHDYLHAMGVKSFSAGTVSQTLGAGKVPAGIAPEAWERVKRFVAGQGKVLRHVC